MANNKKFQDNIDYVNEIATIARKNGMTHLYTENECLDGKYISINGETLINFGSCSYLGLETDARLKEAAIDAVRRFGTQFSSSRTYVSFTLYEELEALLKNIFNNPVILSSTTSLGHQAVVPIIIGDKDAVIMDHQVHASIQDVIPKLQVRGIPVSLLRHSRLDELEYKITKLSIHLERIWYFIDGVYSMYGDLSPIKKLMQMLESHSSLHLYVDDAHGMSWAGEHGNGFVLSQVPLHPRMILSTSLAKGFASAGGVFVIPDHELYWRVKNWGGPLTYSGPQQPAVIGASIASAKIHLSDEIYEKQNSLSQLIQYCNQIAIDYGLPVVLPSHSPVFFIGLGLPKVGYSLIRQLMKSGFYTNLGIFPAVPKNCTGIRFTLTLHHTKEDIRQLIEQIALFLPEVLQEEGRTLQDVYRVFRKTINSSNQSKNQTLKNENNKIAKDNGINLTYTTTIKDIPQSFWDNLLGCQGAFTWKNLTLLEQSFQDNERLEHNWSFHYYIIADDSQRPILATFFTQGLIKEDMLSSSQISRRLEKIRSSDRYHMTSQALLMGTVITEGKHLFLDQSHPKWKNAFTLLLDTLWKKQEKNNIDVILLRDFEENNAAIHSFMLDHGFMKTCLPESHVISNLAAKNTEQYIRLLSSKKRYHIRKDALETAGWFKTEIVSDTHNLNHLYRLYENVVDHSFEINMFKLPKKLFEKIIKSPNWDVISLKLKPDYDPRSVPLPVAVEFSYKNADNYYPILIGLDYKFLDEAKVYKQLLFRILERAIHLRCKNIHFGMTASLEKRKLGAKLTSRVAYVQIKDTYDISLLNLMDDGSSMKIKYNRIIPH